ncbi:MAG: hypothetical protein M3P29_03295 [Acidobacteriota bacterium]|nr:hypothetical protein [Acidobacteriota bacterium]
MILARAPLTRLRQSLAKPVDALPLDLFRILIGLLSLAYFIRTLLEAPDYSGPRGLIDHELSIAVFPFTSMGLFRPGMPLLLFQSIFVIACIASLAVVAGYRVKVSAAVLYAIAVSTYRWNFLVMYVDDVVMHLMLFWLLLLPLGRTLVLTEWLSQRTQVWRRWKTITVPGAAVRCFLWNVALIYIVAGLWKWTSPMWRNGTALYAVLQLPIAWTPDFWSPRYLPLLMALNYAALILETIFPALFFLPKGHRAKYALLMALLAFHCGMILTLQIPFANVACIAATMVLFGPELMSWLRRRPRTVEPATETARIGLSGAIAIAFVITLTLAMLSSVVLPEWRMPVRRRPPVASDNAAFDGLRPLQKAFFVPLWIAGLAQQYQLFNWIDERNYAVRYDAFDGAGAHRIDPAAIFLPTTRGSLLQAYIHGISWMQIPSHRREQLRKSIYIRSASRYCREVAGSSDVAVYSTLRRIDASNLHSSPNAGVQHHALLMQFRCRRGELLMQAMNLNP